MTSSGCIIETSTQPATPKIKYICQIKVMHNYCQARKIQLNTSRVLICKSRFNGSIWWPYWHYWQTNYLQPAIAFRQTWAIWSQSSWRYRLTVLAQLPMLPWLRWIRVVWPAAWISDGVVERTVQGQKGYPRLVFLLTCYQTIRANFLRTHGSFDWSSICAMPWALCMEWSDPSIPISFLSPQGLKNKTLGT